MAGTISFPTDTYTFTTMSEELYNKITKRVSALRRSHVERLAFLCNGMYVDFTDAVEHSGTPTKTELINAVLNAEFGQPTMQTYYTQRTRKQEERTQARRRGQLALPTM